MTNIPYNIKPYIDTDNYTMVPTIHKSGFTGYIDFIDKDYFINDSSVIMGYDYNERFFISVMFYNVLEPNIYKIMTLFQRYKDNSNFYVTCSDTFENYSYVRGCNFNNVINMDEQIKDFFTLINSGEVTRTIENYVYSTDTYQNETNTYCLSTSFGNVLK